jgi:hypothetical protein
MKQWGSRSTESGAELFTRNLKGRRQKHADNFKHWPATLNDLTVRQLP